MAQTINSMNEDLAIHQKMEDEPNDVGGLSSEELKARYDHAALALQKYINEVLVKAHNELAQQLSDHVDVDPGNLTARNIGILRELADQYGLTDKLAPTVHDALEVLNVWAKLKPETAALFGLDETAVPDDVLRKINSDFSRIACGTVTGNSNAGEDEPNSITFPFVPKMVYVTRAERSPLDTAGFVKFDNFLWVEGVTKDAIGQTNYGTKYRCYELVGNTLSWWVDDTNYGAAVIGRYIAFG